MAKLKAKQRFLLVSIIPQQISDEHAVRLLSELKALVDSYGGEVIDWVIQRREVHDKGNYIGDGKIRETAQLVKEKNIDTVVLNSIVKPGQLFELKNVFIKSKPAIEVWDRVDLILHIFSKHAHTAEARLQIELAAMRHMGPRIYGMGMELSQQTGGIGARGIGETNTERMKRHWRDQTKVVQDKLNRMAEERERQLTRRRKAGLMTISLIGYTNAGKTSLFNALTGKNKRVQNALFVTLDSVLGKLYLPSIQREVLISDTIGFIRQLPTKLIEAFESTLMESIHADLLVHVIDITDAEMHKKIAVVEDILLDLRLDNRKKLYVFNKVDVETMDKIAGLKMQYNKYNPQFISVKTGKNLSVLIKEIGRQIRS